MTSWTGWIAAMWPQLLRGDRLTAPPHLMSPALAGLRRLAFGTPSGQSADWSIPYDDGSRAHIHEFADGRLIVHRDRFDPDRGLGNFVAHLMSETFVGPLVIGVVVVAMVSSANK